MSPFFNSIIIVAMLCLLVFFPNSHASPYVKAETFTYSEPVTLETAFDNWKGELLGGEQQFTYNWFESGYRSKNYGIGLLYRYDMVLNFSKDTALYHHENENGGQQDESHEYDLFLDAMRFQGEGLRFSTLRDFNNDLEIEMGVSIFHADDLLDGVIKGSNTEATLDYVYSEDTLLDRVVERPDGYGLSLDTQFVWELNPSMIVDGKVTDLLGVIQWSDAPYTKVNATLDQREFDDDGVLTVKPLISGKEGKHARYRQYLKPRAEFNIKREWAGFQTLATYAYVNEQHLLGLGGGIDTPLGMMGLKFWPQLDTYQLTLQHSRWVLGLGVDALNESSLQTVWANFSYR